MTWPTLKLSPMTTISPSRFDSIQKCPLREVWAAGRAKGLVPSSPSAFLGSVVHRVIEEAMLGTEQNLGQVFEDFASAADDRLRKDPIHRRWVPLSAHAPDYAEMRRRAIERAQAATQKPEARAAPTRRRTGPEVRVSARGGKVRGSIDEVDLSGGRVVLRDLKTGNIRKSGTAMPEPKLAYAKQLRMYAAMYEEDIEISDGKWPDYLELVPLYGPPLAVPYEHAECTALLDQAVETLAAINRTIESHDNSEAEKLLARPAPDTCRWCPYRPACSEYRNASVTIDNPAWPPDVWGIVVDKVLKGNGTLSISLRRGEELYRVRDIPPTPAIHPALEELRLGKWVAFFGLIRSRTAETFAAGAFTVIHLLE